MKKAPSIHFIHSIVTSIASSFSTGAARLRHATLWASFWLTQPVLAANVIPEPKFKGYVKDDVIGTMLSVFKDGSNLGLIIMLVVAFIVVAGLAISGLVKGIQRGEWGTFAGALLGGFIVLAFVGAILFWGGGMVDSIKTTN